MDNTSPSDISSNEAVSGRKSGKSGAEKDAEIPGRVELKTGDRSSPAKTGLLAMVMVLL